MTAYSQRARARTHKKVRGNYRQELRALARAATDIADGLNSEAALTGGGKGRPGGPLAAAARLTGAQRREAIVELRIREAVALGRGTVAESLGYRLTFPNGRAT